MKILCMWHDDRNPTMHVYSDGAYCFACGKQASLAEIGRYHEGLELPPEREPENLEESFAYIDSLPKVSLRGLEFPADEWGYFICWPGRDYYKKRLYDETSGRYRSPTGHKEPMFWARREGNPDLVVIEGQINCLSIAEACLNVDVCSPGGVGNFSHKLTKNQLQEYYIYSTIVIVCDEDAPGAKAAINLYSQLISKGRKVAMKLMKPDANEVLCAEGKERLREEISQAIRAAMETSP